MKTFLIYLACWCLGFMVGRMFEAGRPPKWGDEK